MTSKSVHHWILLKSSKYIFSALACGPASGLSTHGKLPNVAPRYLHRQIAGDVSKWSPLKTVVRIRSALRTHVSFHTRTYWQVPCFFASAGANTKNDVVTDAGIFYEASWSPLRLSVLDNPVSKCIWVCSDYWPNRLLRTSKWLRYDCSAYCSSTRVVV